VPRGEASGGVQPGSLSEGGRYPQCKACVRRWQEKNAEHLADYHRRWQQANRDKQRAQNRRYRERKHYDAEYRERRRANARRRDRERRAQDAAYRERRAPIQPTLSGAEAIPSSRRTSVKSQAVV
jgi:hypothetical protein